MRLVPKGHTGRQPGVWMKVEGGSRPGSIHVGCPACPLAQAIRPELISLKIASDGTLLAGFSCPDCGAEEAPGQVKLKDWNP